VLVIRPSLDVFTDRGLTVGLLLLNPASIISLLLIAVCVLWLILQTNDERQSILFHWFTWVFLGWVALLFFWAWIPVYTTYLHGANVWVGLREWLRMLSLFCLFCLVGGLARAGKQNHLIYALLLSFLLPALVALYQNFSHHGMLVRGVHRVNGTFVHPNPFSFYLVLMLGLLFWQWRVSPYKIRWGVGLLLAFGLLLSTYSFTGAAMFGVMAGIIAIGENRKLRLLAFGLIAIFAILFLASPTGMQRVKMELQFDQLDEIERTGRETSSFTWRLLNWRFLYREWEKSPLFGHGLNTSKLINPMVKGGTAFGFDPHNDYVRYLAETGAIGFLLFLVFLVSTGSALLQSVRHEQTNRRKALGIVAIALFGAWLLGSANDNLISATAYQYGLWAVFSLVLFSSSHSTATGSSL